jgi:hypothetical protein
MRDLSAAVMMRRHAGYLRYSPAAGVAVWHRTP